MLTRLRNTLFAGAAVFALAACDTGTTVAPQDPAFTVADIAGTYTATDARWTAHANAGTQFDLVGTGGTYEMAVLEDGTYTTRIVREGHQDLVTTGNITLDQAGIMTLQPLGEQARNVDWNWQDGTMTWTDTGGMWDFGTGAGMEGATFNGTFTRQ
jgi:hypothetical protein